jgi:YidC/Oxa1 family membrane protein insertase
MEILSFIWETYLYVPLFNVLVWLYLNYSWYNLGIAIIILTIFLRIILLPFSIITERNKLSSDHIQKAVKQINEDFKSDPVKRKIAIREYLKKHKIRPWAKAIVLGVQGLVFLLLYKVFLGGINTQEKLHLLYSQIPAPDFINTSFLWFDIAEPNLLFCALVSGVLFAQLLFDSYESNSDMNKKEHIFTLMFPASIFLILAFLPSAKALFVLTSLVFSGIISLIGLMIKLATKKPEKA